MNTFSPNNKDYIHVYGRTVNTDPMPIFWTAGGVEFVTNSTEAYIEIESDYSINETWIEVEMNDSLLQRFILQKGKVNYLLFKGFSNTEYRKILVRISSQPIQDDEVRKVLVHNISCDGDVKAAVHPERKIEFIGDSLTSGEGLTTRGNKDTWCAGIFGLQGHYALAVAKHFGADYSFISQSGWGVCTGWDNNVNNTIPAYYTQICGILDGESNKKLGAFGEHDFGSWQPEVVLINLGTNDGAATGQPAWTDPVSGDTYKLEVDEAKKLVPEAKAKFENAIVSFIKAVRQNNPGAEIVWAYGMCDHSMEEYIISAVDQYLAETDDKKMGYLSLPEAKEEQLGAHEHPGVKDHEAAALVIIDYLEKKLG